MNFVLRSVLSQQQKKVFFFSPIKCCHYGVSHLQARKPNPRTSSSTHTQQFFNNPNKCDCLIAWFRRITQHIEEEIFFVFFSWEIQSRKPSDWLCHHCALIRRTGPWRSERKENRGALNINTCHRAPVSHLLPVSEQWRKHTRRQPESRCCVLNWINVLREFTTGRVVTSASLTVFSETFRHTRGGLHSFTTSPHKKSRELALYLHLITLTLCVIEQATLCPVRCLTDTSPVRKCRGEHWLLVLRKRLERCTCGEKKGGSICQAGFISF